MHIYEVRKDMGEVHMYEVQMGEAFSDHGRSAHKGRQIETPREMDESHMDEARIDQACMGKAHMDVARTDEARMD